MSEDFPAVEFPLQRAEMSRWVLDTNVVISALFWGGEPRALLTAARERRVQLFTSVPMLDELADVLVRDKFVPKIRASGLDADALIMRYAALCTVVRTVPLSYRVAPDPDDDAVIATALAANATVIVTGDKPFLSVREFNGITLATVRDVVALLE